MKLIYYIIIFQFCIVIISCNEKFDENERILYENIILENENLSDLNQLKLNFSNLQNQSSENESKKLDVVYKVLLANYYSKLYDKINPRSSILFEDAVKSSKITNDNNLITWVNTQFGFYYYTFSEYTKAFPYFMESSRILDSNDDKNLFQASEILKRNAFYFGAVNDKEKEIIYLNRALASTPNNSKEYANILNAIGHHYLKLGNLEKAKDYFLKTMLYSKKNLDEIRYAKSLGDMANIYKIQKKYKQATDLLKEDIKISKRKNDERNTMYAKILLGKVYLDQAKYDEAYEILDQAHLYASKKEYLKSYVLEIKELLLLIAIKNNDTKKELLLRRELDQIKNDLSKYNGLDVINSINWQLQKENINYKLEAEITKSEKEATANKTLFLISVFLLFTILLIIINYRKRLKRQSSEYENTVLKLQIEKLKSEKKLGQTHKTLNSYKTYLSEKNNQIEELKYEINNIRDSKISYLEERKGELNKLLNSHLMTEENWLAFKQTFIHEKSDFYKFLMENYPNLTESNLRIIFLHKLGLSNSETAHLLGVTIDAVKKAKQRLRKKYPDSYEYLLNNDK